MQGFTFYNFLLFEIESGKKVLDIKNEDPIYNPSFKATGSRKDMRLMAVIVNENK